MRRGLSRVAIGGVAALLLGAGPISIASAASASHGAHVAKRHGTTHRIGRVGKFHVPSKLECSYDSNNVFDNRIDWSKHNAPSVGMVGFWHQPRHGSWKAQGVALYERFQVKVGKKWHNSSYKELLKQVAFGHGTAKFSASQHARTVVQHRYPTDKITATRATLQLVWYRPTTHASRANVKDGIVTAHIKKYTSSLNDGIHTSCRARYGPPWRQLAPAQAPTARTGAASAFDASTGQVVLFGGYDGSSVSAETWTWNGTAWTLVQPATTPPARTGAAMAYDATHHTVVMFGGLDSTNAALNDTWQWNGTDWSKAQGGPTGSKTPPARGYAAMAYDSLTQSTVMFGGSSGSQVLRDTWVWNGTTWSGSIQVNGPDARQFASESTTATGGVVLFGGVDSSGGLLDDTWEYGNSGAWVQYNESSRPAARGLAAMGYDSTTDQAVLFGGCAGTTTCFNDTWAYTAKHLWVNLSPPAAPPARQDATMSYDAATSSFVLFGGTPYRGAPSRLNDTWSLASG
ncbi:MAG TPA: kelch repeat-containing protein [Mycobacteriales bacterium]|nr:kelch repeat-containing protein [Mycobacteriales bacterium]